MSNINKILILGGGQAAVYAASELRKHDPQSLITIFSEENYLPYERPPLSKDFLMNKKKEEELLFFSKNFFEDQNINWVNDFPYVNSFILKNIEKPKKDIETH